MTYTFTSLGDRAVMIEAASEIGSDAQRQVRMITALLESESPSWVLEYIPAFTTVAIFYDPMLLTYRLAVQQLQTLLNRLAENRLPAARTIEIPVCYGGEFGPDLAFVASHNNLTEEDVIRLHTSGEYSVYMIGFAPGFPFLGGMPEQIAAPRKDSPRLRIPERTVGIAGKQTGIYPIETPGGWQLIGRTPLRLFLPENEVPSLLQAGDSITFKEISKDEYYAYKEQSHAEDQ
ncbi:5-oxoprolinase subunit PxpB [Planococcus lenghuensis]|uniref:Kinase inhibitor n=1 Tax=Planococcus lenghuensis TaxID=2213202 RepID=A0A1Q2L269_9BACL|nr:5-oxoprolinase subunit PxpB [Planococcus lenghuensis]AQQ54521.1 kinase inhibitor [Planococcus lenghuensis]